MSALLFLLPLALLLGLTFAVLFLWAARGGQFDDLETPGRRMLDDDAPAKNSPSSPRYK